MTKESRVLAVNKSDISKFGVYYCMVESSLKLWIE